MFGKKAQQRVRILLAEDHLAVAEGLRAILEPALPEVSVAGAVTVQVVKTEITPQRTLLMAFGKQRRSCFLPQGGFTCGGEVLQDVTLLLGFPE